MRGQFPKYPSYLFKNPPKPAIIRPNRLPSFINNINIRKSMATKVYLIDSVEVDSLENDVFKSISEDQSNVFSFSDFTSYYNSGRLNGLIKHSIVRIL